MLWEGKKVVEDAYFFCYNVLFLLYFVTFELMS